MFEFLHNYLMMVQQNYFRICIFLFSVFSCIYFAVIFITVISKLGQLMLFKERKICIKYYQFTK